MGLFDVFKKKAAGGSEIKTIRISDFLTKRTIAFFPTGPSKQQLFGNLIGNFDLDDPSSAIKAVITREEAGSTVVAPDLALPHARISGLNTIKAALGIIPGGMDYSRATGSRVRLVVLFLGPAENMRLHLAFLAQVSALFQKRDICEAVVASGSPEAALKVIRDAEESL